MSRFLLDTTVFLYALGREHSYKMPCSAIVEALKQSGVEGVVSVDLIQEFVHVRIKRGHDASETLRMAEGIISLCEVHDFESRDLHLALRLFGEHPKLDFRDAIFAATAINRGIDKIISADRDFDTVPQLQRVDPADAAAIAELIR